MDDPPFEPHVAPPSRAAPPRPDARRIAYGTAPQQFGDLRLPAGQGPHPVVVVVHGGAYRSRYHLDLMHGICADLARRGLATWNIEYRRGDDPGAEWPGMFRDVAAATDHVRVLAASAPIDPRRVLTLGHSAGGHLALWLAARTRLGEMDPLAADIAGIRADAVAGRPGPAGSAPPPTGAPAAGSAAPAAARPLHHEPLAVAAAVALAPVTDLVPYFETAADRQHLFGGPPTSVPAHYAAVSPAAALPLGVRQLIVHGSEDQSVAVADSRRYVRAAQAAGDDARLLEMTGVEHFEPIYADSGAWAQVAAEVSRLAAGSGW